MLRLVTESSVVFWVCREDSSLWRMERTVTVYKICRLWNCFSQLALDHNSKLGGIEGIVTQGAHQSTYIILFYHVHHRKIDKVGPPFCSVLAKLPLPN